ncbi:hypothetical protein GWG65_09290 [Bradyrhizobium sp. CSA207]|uniref:hypothetical protein n=1 Tax=Bradyrhizobium sp. CSA207 TaxID=2698826 RepID=UPI0023B114DD|nr:hypothetical protein [Bradyrhizobium sp. CSA207]MDE5441638.1 hypothetical protein [Bradyrhizobium sp. CSA207]
MDRFVSHVAFSSFLPGGVDEAAGLDDRGSQQSRLCQQILRHVRRSAQAALLPEHRDRMLDLALNAGFQMVLVLANSGQVGDDFDG